MDKYRVVIETIPAEQFLGRVVRVDVTGNYIALYYDDGRMIQMCAAYGEETCVDVTLPDGTAHEYVFDRWGKSVKSYKDGKPYKEGDL